MTFDVKEIQPFPDPSFKEGWAITHYSTDGNFSEVANRIYVCKYNKGGYSIQDRKSAGDRLLIIAKEFISFKWPRADRPFDAVVTPPQNLAKEFNLTAHIAENLKAGNIDNLSDFLKKSRDIKPLKNISLELERVKEIDKGLKFEYPPMLGIPQGILILDDILGTGTTAREVSRAIRENLPGVPQYYLALTYIKGQAIE
jgi:hypothetical protein